MSMHFWPGLPPQDCLTRTEAWQARARTVEAIGLLCLARATIALIPFGWWRQRIGAREHDVEGDPLISARLSAHVERAAWRLPFATKCLPRALALSWMLRRRGIGHCVVVAIRPEGRRELGDSLHAWVETDGRIVLGELPGPWHVIHSTPR